MEHRDSGASLSHLTGVTRPRLQSRQEVLQAGSGHSSTVSMRSPQAGLTMTYWQSSRLRATPDRPPAASMRMKTLSSASSPGPKATPVTPSTASS